MPEQGLKARVLVGGVPTETGLTGLLGGVLPTVPVVIGGRATTVGPALASALQGAHTPVSDADYQCLPSDLQVGIVALTAPRTISLPDVDSFPFRDLVIADESGQCSETLTITIQPGAGTGDTIAGASSLVLSSPYQGLRFRRGAANLWIRL